MNEPFQLKLLRQQADLRARLRDAHDARKVVAYGLRVAQELLGAKEGAIAALKPGRKNAHVIHARPRGRDWDEDLLTRYVLGERPPFPETLLLAPVKRRGRHWAVLALRNAERSFELAERDALYALAQTLTTIVQRLDEKRSRKVRRKIERKIAEHREPKDLIYDLLHGLRSLIRYDHSAALLIARHGAESLELVAEQIAWTKARSRRIGLRIELDEAQREALETACVSRFERDGDGWQDARACVPTSLPERLEAGAPRGAPGAVAMLCAPIATPEGVFAVLKVSARRSGVLGDWEARRVEEFLPLASLAVQFSVRTESLQEQVLRSERKHALANLTRGIAHDVNNALGAMLPLVQQMREDARRGELDVATLDGDLASLESSLQTCRRIFGGMLAIARGSGPGVGHGNLRRAIDGTLSVLGDSLARRAIEVAVKLPRELPPIRGSQGDLTQLFLNLCANARDAMPEGGELRITGENGHRKVRVTVEDSGHGIPASIVDRISEPFFTTKAEGNGLGLSICRSILWDIGGEMKIHSAAGEGTRVLLSLPVLQDDGAEASP